jgi:hypothetical protein
MMMMMMGGCMFVYMCIPSPLIEDHDKEVQRYGRDHHLLSFFLSLSSSLTITIFLSPIIIISILYVYLIYAIIVNIFLIVIIGRVIIILTC